MKVILLQDIKSLGRKYDIRVVKNGYARNFLIPKGLAKIATKQTIQELVTKKAAWEKEKQETKTKLETLAKDLAGQEFCFKLKTGKKGEVFGSVAKEDIKKTIETQFLGGRRFLISKNNIKVNLERPIKTLGRHQVEIDLGGGVKTVIKVIIEPSQP